MKDSHIIGFAALLAAGLLFTYWELKKSQGLLNTILVNIRELRTVSYPTKENNSLINKANKPNRLGFTGVSIIFG